MKGHLTFGPPGTGKTTRLLDLMGEELGRVLPGSIAFSTFTRSARSEAMGRAEARFGVELPWCRTLHSAAFRLLGLEGSDLVTGKRLGEFCRERHWALSEDSGGDIEEPMTAAERAEDDQLRRVYELGRSLMVGWRRAAAIVGGVDVWRLERFVADYERWKRAQKLYDFTDLLEEALRSEERPPVTVAFVDEAQDLSPLQQALVRHWYRGCERVYVAGDDDQAIYGFQGASPAWLLALRDEWESEVLGTSYRLPEAIRAFGQRIIGRNRLRVPKEYRAHRAGGTVETVESREVVDWLQADGSAFALLRNRALFDRVALPLFEARVPYAVEGGGASRAPYNSRKQVDAVRTLARLESTGRCEAGALVDALAFVPSRGADILPHGAKAAAGRVEGTVTASAAVLQLGLGRLLQIVGRDGPAAPLLKMPAENRSYFADLYRRHRAIPEPRIRITTVHGSKGREADSVLVCPDMSRASYRELVCGGQDGREAENRVAYVAITRARARVGILRGITREQYPYPS